MLERKRRGGREEKERKNRITCIVHVGKSDKSVGMSEGGIGGGRNGKRRGREEGRMEGRKGKMGTGL